MKKFLLASAFMIVGVSPSYAEMSSYVSGNVGYNSTPSMDWSNDTNSGEDEVDGTATFGAAYGVNVTPNIRTELEISYRDADYESTKVDGLSTYDMSGSFQTWGVLVNGYYDFAPQSAFSPYVSAGVGALMHEGKIDSVATARGLDVEATDTTFGYQLGIGVGYEISDRLTLDGGYRYLGSSDIDFEGTDTEYGAHEFRAGLRYSINQPLPTGFSN